MFSGAGITDYNNDGWEDIVLWWWNGISIYKNIWGTFARDTSIFLWDELSVIESPLANFYDLDGDSWKDLLIMTRNKWVFILWNNAGNISIQDSLQFDITPDESQSYGLSLGDLFDNDTIDIFIWESSFIKKQEGSPNFLLKNRNFTSNIIGSDKNKNFTSNIKFFAKKTI